MLKFKALKFINLFIVETSHPGGGCDLSIYGRRRKEEEEEEAEDHALTGIKNKVRFSS